MSLATKLVNGNKGKFDAGTLTPMQKLTLRFVLVGLVHYGFAAMEGMLMRIYQVEPIELIDTKQYFGILTAHPLVGIFGSTYLIVFGAFLFLVPFLLKKPLWSFRLATWAWGLITFGVATFWLDGFISHYAPLCWPLPADFKQFSPVSGAIFIVGIALIMVGTLLFVVNIFATLLYTPAGAPQVDKGATLLDGLGFTGMFNLFRGRQRSKDSDFLVLLPVVAITRATVEVALNTVVILFTGVLILVSVVAKIFGVSLRDSAIDALLYENWFWWGLDLVADGLVLVFVAGTWYLMATLITGRSLFMQNWARAALAVELVVSWTVWSHHPLINQGQPVFLKIAWARW